MDLASAVRFLLAYEASLNLAPGQKPPPPSPSVFNQLSQAVTAIESMVGQEMHSNTVGSSFSGLPPSVWSDWPLCCGLDLTPQELQAARTLFPPLLRDRGLLSLFLALHSCAEAGVDHASYLAPDALFFLARLHTVEEDDPAPFPSAHLAARVGHRLINADGTLDFLAGVQDGDLFDMWASCIFGPVSILDRSTATSALPHEAAGLSLAKEMAAMLDAFCAAQRGMGGIAAIQDEVLCNGLPFLLVMNFLYWADEVLHLDEETAQGQPILWNLRKEMYREAAALPAYDPVLLLQSFFRNIDSRFGRGSLSIEEWSEYLEGYRFLLWTPLTYRASLSKVRPANAYTAMRLGLEDLRRQEPVDDGWSTEFLTFALHALYSGLVQPELILRARPQLLEGLVEGLARGRIRGTKALMKSVSVVSLLAHSPAVGFHLRKFFSRSGCLQIVRETLFFTPNDSGRELIRLLGPRVAQVDIKPDNELQSGWLALCRLLANGKQGLEDTVEQMDTSFPARLCDFIIRDLTLDSAEERLLADPLLQFLSELIEEIAAPRRPHAQYGVLMMVEIGKACLAFSSTVARALKDIEEAGPEGKGGRGPRGAGANGKGSVWRWRVPLVAMARVLSLLRRRVLRELLPLAEAREAALWEGVSEEEVVAALTEGA